MAFGPTLPRSAQRPFPGHTCCLGGRLASLRLTGSAKMCAGSFSCSRSSVVLSRTVNGISSSSMAACCTLTCHEHRSDQNTTTEALGCLDLRGSHVLTNLHEGWRRPPHPRLTQTVSFTCQGHNLQCVRAKGCWHRVLRPQKRSGGWPWALTGVTAVKADSPLPRSLICFPIKAHLRMAPSHRPATIPLLLASRLGSQASFPSNMAQSVAIYPGGSE